MRYPIRNRLLYSLIPAVFIVWGLFLDSLQRGDVSNTLALDTLAPVVEGIEATFTDLKFHYRGPVPLKNKVVVVGVDERSIATHGRWPWDRERTSLLIAEVLARKPRAVALDIVFNSPEPIPFGFKKILDQAGLNASDIQARSDHHFADTVFVEGKSKVVLGWQSSSPCQPLITPADQCAKHFKTNGRFPAGQDKFAFGGFEPAGSFDVEKTPIWSVVQMNANVPELNRAARFAGFFNAVLDRDGTLRRAPLVFFAGAEPYPSLALEAARAARQDSLILKTGEFSEFDSVRFRKDGQLLLANHAGLAEINFRGPAQTVPHVSATDVLAGDAASEILEGAVVVIGTTAPQVLDIIRTPFDPRTPGPEAQATVIDNILANDFIHSSSMGRTRWLLLFGIAVSALVAAVTYRKLSAAPALATLLGLTLILFIVDFALLFPTGLRLASSPFWLNWACVVLTGAVAQYVDQEKKRRFLRGAFARYLSPELVEVISNDPTQLSLSGQKKELTVLFSDIRNFTDFSERMEPQQLSAFLNSYLGEMTDIVFDTRGTLDKYIGDAVMAFWGAPVTLPDHAHRAVSAAVRMLGRIEALRPKVRELYGIDLRVGIGVNSGEVSVGNMGCEQNMEYTVIGDNVNLCSRLESVTKFYGVSCLATRTTMNAVEKSGHQPPPHRTIDLITVKGKSTASEIVQILESPWPEEWLHQFAEARALYLNLQFEEAREAFRVFSTRVFAKTGEPDGPSERLILNCSMYLKQPPEVGWDGSWKMTRK